jgi:hypothetical protein
MRQDHKSLSIEASKLGPTGNLIIRGRTLFIEYLRKKYSGFMLAALVFMTFRKIRRDLCSINKAIQKGAESPYLIHQGLSLYSYLGFPNSIPWQRHFAGPHQDWNFSSLWDEVFPRERRDDSNTEGFAKNDLFNESKEFYLYFVRNGTLYRSKRTPLTLMKGRARKFEDLMSSSLDMARHAAGSHDDTPIDSRLRKLSTDSFPFFLDSGDFWSCKNKAFPFFTFATFEQETPDEKCIPIAVPSYEQWYYGKDNSTEWDAQFEKQEKNFNWESKINKAVWRGAATGLPESFPNWQDLPRANLVKMSLNYPDLLDAGFKGASQRSKVEQNEMESMGYMKKRMNMDDFQKYKAVIDIDGNSWSSRFVRLLCMNSVVLKVQPSRIDYFYSELKPWVHYLPVHANMSNLIDVVRVAVSEDEETKLHMQSIVKNANHWCKQKVIVQSMTLDMTWIMISYIEILRKENLHSYSLSKWKNKIIVDENEWNKDWVEIPAFKKHHTYEEKKKKKKNS